MLGSDDRRRAGFPRVNRLYRNTLALCIGTAFAPAAAALSLNPGGTGQVLVYPYYTVNDNQQTVVSVVNTTDRAKAVKVRFREGRNGKPVLEFNLYLSPFDAWQGAVTASTDTRGAALVTADASCTAPGLRGPVRFVATGYTGANQDWTDAFTPPSLSSLLGSIERTREGHIEVIEMGLLQSGTLATQLAEEVAHGPSGVPVDCLRVIDAWTPPTGGWVDNPAGGIDRPAGGLYGNAAIVDVANGTLQSYEADAIEAFYTNGAEPGFLHRSPAAGAPDLGDADSGNGSIAVRLFVDEEITQRVPARRKTRTTDQPYSYDAVSLLFMTDAIHNEFNTESGLGAASEWVMTFPTRSAYVDTDRFDQVRKPFTDAFAIDGRSCEPVSIAYWNRAGASSGFRPGFVNFFVPPLQANLHEVAAVCHQSTVFALNQEPPLRGDPSVILGARYAGGFRTTNVAGLQYDAGWMRVTFDNPLSTGPRNVLDNRVNDPVGGVAFAGLPVTGFWAASYVNADSSPGILASYNATVRHRTKPRAVSAP